MAAANEERFARVKGAGGWPACSIEAVLEGAGLRPRDVSAVAVAGLVNPNPVLRFVRAAQVGWTLDTPETWAPRGPVARAVEALQVRSPFPYARSDGLLAHALAPLARHALVRDLGWPEIPSAFLDHHRCHAASAWYTAGWDDGLVLVADGVGDGLALSVWEGHGAALRRVDAWPHPHSHGLVYATVTALLGFRPFRHEGKLVGLAAHGDPDAVRVPWPFEGPPRARRLVCGLGPGLRRHLAPLAQHRREDVCAWLQRGLEHDLIALVRAWAPRRLALAGGVFANVRLNQRLAEEVESLWVFPHMGDGGLAVGAALAVAACPPVAMDTAYLGALPADAPGRLDHPGRIADRLVEGALVGVCRGRAEVGPRALGNRSIFADPRSAAVVGRLNAALRRSDFMPFAPMIRAEAASRLFRSPSSAAKNLAFMTVTVDATPALCAACPAVVHVDGTLRPQVVAPGGFLDDVLAAFEARTGVPVLLNTSFNLHEEPIVQSWAEAERTAARAGLGELVG